MKTTTTKAKNIQQITAQPVAHIDGLPVFKAGTAPENLCTQGQLTERRLKLAAGQQPRAYVRIRRRTYHDVPLYRVDEAARMRPLSALQQRQILARRICVLCAVTADSPLWELSHPWLPVHGRVCAACDQAAHERWERTCGRCTTRFRHRSSVRYRRCTPCTEAEQAGREVAYRLTRRHCPGCAVETATREEVEAADAAVDYGRAIGYPRTCEPCQAEQQRREEESRRAAERARWDELGPVRQWARRVVEAPHEYAVVDTETTGLDWDAKVVEISITDGAGAVLLDTLVHPGTPIPNDAAAIHGITDEDVKEAPTFGAVLPRITAALAGRRVIIYNRQYDYGVLRYELDRHHRDQAPTLPATRLAPEEWHPAAADWMDSQQWDRCAMLAYAVHVGEWSNYWGGWSWQRLNGGHRALGDCRAVVDRIREMAERPDPF
ncbi:exonuclease domain-containing protein [Streptomyces spororaveus]|uniref:3'-5' exonuclease n=1 Tax=Streptomyces spororaveus TaxID=284039 RepID=UPI00368D5F27